MEHAYVLDSILGTMKIVANMGVCSLVEKTDIKPISIEFTYSYTS